jgi:AcrR family transcriptional regulator
MTPPVKSPRKTPRTLSAAPPPRRAYHHGDLRRTLVETTVRLVEARGLDQVSMREVAMLAGVSPAAPFRHFPSRVALLTAVAEEAMDRLTVEIDRALAAASAASPLMQFRAIGSGFLRWAIANPAHFQVISTRALIDFEGSSLRRRNDAIRATMADLVSRAATAGLLRPGDLDRYLVGGRALAYGIARMYVDGQFPSWGLNEAEAVHEGEAILDQFIASIAA